MAANASPSFLDSIASRRLLASGLCGLALLMSSVASSQIQQIPDKRPDRAEKFEVITPQSANTIQVTVRYRKQYGYKYASGVFNGSGPTSCAAFHVSARPDPAVRQASLFGIHNPDTMGESGGLYVCEFLVTDLPLNAPISVGVDLADHRTLPVETWNGGDEPQPPPGQQRTIINVSGRTSRTAKPDAQSLPQSQQAQNGQSVVTLTETQPRARLVFEMVYAQPVRVVTSVDKIDARPARDQVFANTTKTDPDSPTYHELRCRGGPGIRFVTVEGRTNSSGEQTEYMHVYFNAAAQSAATGLSLQPGQCAYPERAVRADEGTDIMLEVVNFAQTQQQLHGTPVDASPTAAERYPDAQNVPIYLSDANHYWIFFVFQTAPLPSGGLEALSIGRYWKPGLNRDEAVRPVDPKRTTKTDPHVLTPKR